jgi:site-specific DNA-methyltransferase (adenine-specific)
MTAFELRQADAVELLLSLPARSVDLIATDPAYQSLEKHRKRGTTTRLKAGGWFDIFPDARYTALFAAMFRALRPDTHAYVMCDDPTSYVVKPIAEAAGFTYWKRVIWDKVKIGMGYHYRGQHENILFFEKGSRKLNDLGVSDVLRFERVQGGYPTEKPVALLEVLIRQSTEPGELVVDPFMGSGSTGRAAVRLGRSFLGGDIAPAALELAHRNITAESRDQPKGRT